MKKIFNQFNIQGLLKNKTSIKVLTKIFDEIPFPIFAKDLKGKYILFNKKCEEITELKKTRVLGKNDFEIFPKKIAKLYQEDDKKILKLKKPLEFEEKKIRKLQKKIFIGLSIKSPLFDSSGKVYGLIGTIVNITKRKKAEEALSASQTKIRALLQSTHDAIVSSDNKGKIIGWNKGAQKTFGYKESEIIGKNLTTLMPHAFRAMHQKSFQRLNGGRKPKIIGKTVEMIGLKKNGEKFPIELSLSTWKSNGENFYTGIIRDITAHKKLHSELETKQKIAEELAWSLKKEKDRLSIQYEIAELLAQAETIEEAAPKILKTIGEGLKWKLGEFWRIQNEKLYLIFMWNSPFIKNIAQFEKTTRLLNFQKGEGLPGRAWQSEKPIWITDVLKDFQFKRKDAAVKENLHSAFAFPIVLEGKIYGVIDFFTNETKPIDNDILKSLNAIGHQIGQFIERKQSEKFLNESEERFRTIFRNSAVGISVIDTNAKILMTNPAFQKMLEYSENELKDKTFKDYTFKVDIKKSLAFYKEMKDGKRDYCQFEKRYVKKTGEIITVNLTSSLVKDIKNKPQFIINMVEDITSKKQNEKLLIDLNKKVTNILESITDSFYTLNKNWEFVYVNNQAEKFFNRTREDLLSRNIWEVFPHLKETTFYQKHKEAKTTQKAVYFDDYSSLAKKWFEVRIYPAKDSLAVYLSDDTKRKLAEEEIKKEKEFSERLLNSSIDGIIAFDRDLRVNLWNPRMEEITGITHKKALKKEIFNLLPNFKKIEEKKYLREVLKGKAVALKDKIFVERKTKKSLYFEIYYSPLFNDLREVIGGLAIVHEVTERKELERKKDEFMAIASHELKTPITTIKAFAQILEKHIAKTKDKKSIYFLENINSQTNRLTALINDLLDVTKIEAGKLVLYRKEFDLDKLIRKTVVDFQYLTELEIKKEGEVKEDVFGDEYRIGQVIANLLTNAIKYSFKAKKIIVHAKTEGDFAVVGIQDFGIGIPKDKQSKIFERFYRLGEKNENTSGFGLGLYISKEIIDRHQGKIWVESEVGKGSTFYFTLPITKQLPIKI